jgi:ABC-type multidrug transport system permease subunit
MVQSRIKPYSQQVAERTARERQQRAYRRNQVFGVMLVAAAIFVVWLLRTNPKWIFTPGWWRP